MNKTASYFATAKRAAKKHIADTSKAHAVAIESLRASIPNKPDAFYADMGWQVVMAAR